MRFNDFELDIRDLATPVFTIPVRREDMENELDSGKLSTESIYSDVDRNLTSNDQTGANSPEYLGLWMAVIIVSVILFIASIILTFYAINKTKNKNLKTVLIVGLFIPPIYPIVSIISLLIIFGAIN